MKTYRIYPSIGIARVGNSPEGYYIGAEAPDINFVPHPDGLYRDGEDKIKRMGCRFRIYEFDDNDMPIREITEDETDITSVTWEVELVNKKAAKLKPDGTPLNLGPSPEDVTISGIQTVVGIDQNFNLIQELAGEFGPPGGANTLTVKLGNLITDDKGRLIVLGGHGESVKWGPDASDPTSVDNPGWRDDTSDGPVRATISFTVGPSVDAESAWVLIGPPDFAHPVVNIVTLYDIVQDRSESAPLADPSFKDDIYPLLHRTVFYQWTLFETASRIYGRSAMHGHTGNIDEHPIANFLDPEIFRLLRDINGQRGKDARQKIFEQLKDPDGKQESDEGKPFNMPPLTNLTLTPTQYKNFKRWSKGNFDPEWPDDWDPVEPPQRTFDDIPLKNRPTALTEAALGGCVGGSFEPGIEAGSIMGEAETYRAPFRISSKIKPGELTEELSVPWQADFNMCTGEWWPGARPVFVIFKNQDGYTRDWWTRPFSESALLTQSVKDDNQKMVENWSKLGFIVKDLSGGMLRSQWRVWGKSVGHPDLQYIETERTLPT